MAVSALFLTLAAACDTGSNRKSVSSALFIAPTTSAPEIGVLADKLDFLRAIKPNAFDTDLEGQPTDSSVLGRLSVYDDADGSVTEIGDLMVYENQSRSIETVDMCLPGTNPIQCGAVKLNYNSAGIDDAESSQGGITQRGGISTSVQTVKLKNGWILAYDGSSKNILAFREEAPRLVKFSDGTEQLVSFRGFTRQDGTATKNFGQGNGLVLSLVISGQDLARQIKVPAQPIVTVFYELEENKILLFFSTLREVQMLELAEEEVLADWDLDDPGNPDLRLPIKLLRGTIREFPSDPADPDSPLVPFLTFDQIAENFTGNPDVDIDSFQPILVPNTGAGLVFERTTSQFLQFFAEKEIVQGQEVVTGGGARRAILPSKLLDALQKGSGGTAVATPLEFGGRFHHQTLPAICLFDEKTNICLNYFYEDALSDNVRVFVSSSSVLQPRAPGGVQGGAVATEPELEFAVNDVDDNRLTFDVGQDQLLSFNYSTGVVTVAAVREQLTAVTGFSLSDLSYIEPVDNERLRVFDSQSNALLSVDLHYVPFPVIVE